MARGHESRKLPRFSFDGSPAPLGELECFDGRPAIEVRVGFSGGYAGHGGSLTEWAVIGTGTGVVP